MPNSMITKVVLLALQENRRYGQKHSKRLHTSGMINFPVSKQTAGRVQYATKGIDVHGYTIAFM